MIYHTMIVSFPETVPDAELDQFLSDIEKVMRDSGYAQTVSSRRHIRIPADAHSPVFIASAAVQIGLADLDALNGSFAAPGIEELIEHWQAKYPYKVVWVNHEQFA